MSILGVVDHTTRLNINADIDLLTAIRNLGLQCFQCRIDLRLCTFNTDLIAAGCRVIEASLNLSSPTQVTDLHIATCGGDHHTQAAHAVKTGQRIVNV